MCIPGRLATAACSIAAASLLSTALLRLAAVHADAALIALCANAAVVELWLATAAFVIALGVVSRSPYRVLGLAPGRLTRAQLGWLALGTLGASHALDGALELSGLAERSVLARMQETLAGAQGAGLLFALVALGLLPGLAEELLCRGLVQRGLERRFGPALAIPAAALLFGALHMEAIHGAFATLLGLYLGLVAYWGGSTRPAMLCHALNNLAAVLLAARLGDVPWPASASLLGGALLTTACLLAAARSLRRTPALQPGPRTSDR